MRQSSLLVVLPGSIVCDKRAALKSMTELLVWRYGLHRVIAQLQRHGWVLDRTPATSDEKTASRAKGILNIKDLRLSSINQKTRTTNNHPIYYSSITPNFAGQSSNSLLHKYIDFDSPIIPFSIYHFNQPARRLQAKSHPLSTTP